MQIPNWRYSIQRYAILLIFGKSVDVGDQGSPHSNFHLIYVSCIYVYVCCWGKE